MKYCNNFHKCGLLFCADDTIDTKITEAEIHSLLNDSNKIWATPLTKLMTDMMEEVDDTLVVCHVQKPTVLLYILRDIGLDSEPFIKKSNYDTLWNINVNVNVNADDDVDNNYDWSHSIKKTWSWLALS